MKNKKDNRKQDSVKKQNKVSGYKLKKSDKILFGKNGLINIIIRADISGREVPDKDLLKVKFDKDESPKSEKKRGNKVKKMRKGM